MHTLNLEQGTPEWEEARARYLTASEAPAMMGVHPTVSRNDLLRAKFDGGEKEISRFVREKIFGRGHAVEAATRPIAEQIIGQELYPATAVDDDGRLSASLDGGTMDMTVLWEGKQWNEAKATEVEAGRCPECDYPQVQQQLLVTGAEKLLYTVSNGTEEGTRSCWVEPDPEYQDRLLAGWKQFEADLAEYEPPEEDRQAVGAKMSDLPTLHVEVEGKVLATNLDQYRDHALAVFEAINEDLQTDEDFATAEETVKWCKTVEDKLEFAKEQALAQTASIDDLFRTVDEIKETARQKRLSLDKLVKARKSEVRTEIADEAQRKLLDHMDSLNARVAPVIVPWPAADFAGAMKGKRTIKSLRDAVDQVLANAKLEANAVADRIDANLRAYKELAAGYETLFPDLDQIALKEPDDFQAAVKLRITEHKEAEARREQQRLEAEGREKEQAAHDQANAALKQQAEAAAVEKSGTGQKTQDTERWQVTVTLVSDVPAGKDAVWIENGVSAKLSAAGFKSVTRIYAEKRREAA